MHKATDQALKEGYTSFVVSGVFSPVNSSQEEAAADIIHKHAATYHAGEPKLGLLANVLDKPLTAHCVLSQELSSPHALKIHDITTTASETYKCFRSDHDSVQCCDGVDGSA